MATNPAQILHEDDVNDPSPSRYLALAWRIVPIQPKGKEFKIAKPWAELRKTEFTADDFDPGDNIGLDPSSAGLVDVDLDCLEAVALGGLFLPETGLIFGRPRKPKSHYLYRCPLEEDVKLTLDGETLLELRTGASGHTRIPPGVHTNDDGTEEPIAWVKFGEPTSVEAPDLRRRAGLLAATTAIARAYPPQHSRHEWSLALWGALRQLGVTQDEAELMLRGIALVAEDETKHGDRLEDLRSTYRKPEGAALAGFGVLRKKSPKLVKHLTSFLGGIVTDSRGFIRNDKGAIDRSNQKNYRIALERKGVELAHNGFRRTNILRENGRERDLEDAVRRRARFMIHEEYGFLPQKDLFEEVTYDLSWLNQFHPVRDYLEGLPAWDGKPRLDTWLSTYGDAEDTPYTRAVGRLPLIAAVKRVYEPGMKFDELLVLESKKQGIGKSTTVKNLCPRVEWYSSDLPLGVDSQKVIERTKGKWIIEIEDMFGLYKVDQIKGFLSRQTDLSRKAYGHEPEEVPRQWIAIGTTNRTEYLIDPTGNRRFWPVRLTRIDEEAVRRDRDQLWGEAFARREESIRLDPSLYQAAAEEQKQREEEDPWEPEIKMLLLHPSPVWRKRTRDGMVDDATPGLRLTTNEVLGALGIPIDRQDTKSSGRVQAILMRLGFERTKVRRDDGDGRQTVMGWAWDSTPEQPSLFPADEG